VQPTFGKPTFKILSQTPFILPGLCGIKSPQILQPHPLPQPQPQPSRPPPAQPLEQPLENLNQLQPHLLNITTSTKQPCLGGSDFNKKLNKDLRNFIKIKVAPHQSLSQI